MRSMPSRAARTRSGRDSGPKPSARQCLGLEPAGHQRALIARHRHRHAIGEERRRLRIPGARRGQEAALARRHRRQAAAARRDRRDCGPAPAACRHIPDAGVLASAGTCTLPAASGPSRPAGTDAQRLAVQPKRRSPPAIRAARTGSRATRARRAPPLRRCRVPGSSSTSRSRDGARRAPPLRKRWPRATATSARTAAGRARPLIAWRGNLTTRSTVSSPRFTRIGNQVPAGCSRIAAITAASCFTAGRRPRRAGRRL